MGQQEVMGGADAGCLVLDARCVHTYVVTQVGAAHGFVQRCVRIDALTEGLRDQVNIVTKGIGGLAIQPAAGILQMLGQVPVIEGDKGLDVVLSELIEQLDIPLNTGSIGAAITLDDSRPRNGQAIGIHPKSRDQLNVFLPAGHMITGHGAIRAIKDGARLVAEGIPYRWLAALCRALNLERGSADTKNKVGSCHG